MRLWSEERRSGTIELLLTLPVTAWQAIVGKFLASWIFLAIAMALTFPVVDHRQLARRPGQRRDPRRLHRQLAPRRRLSRRELPDLGDDAQPGGELHPVGGDLPRSWWWWASPRSPIFWRAGRAPWFVEAVAGFSVLTHFDGFQKGVIDSARLRLLRVGDRLRAVRDRRHPARPSGGVGSFGNAKEHRALALFHRRRGRGLHRDRRRQLHPRRDSGPHRPDRGQALHAVGRHAEGPRKAGGPGPRAVLLQPGRGLRAGADSRVRAAGSRTCCNELRGAVERQAR